MNDLVERTLQLLCVDEDTISAITRIVEDSGLGSFEPKGENNPDNQRDKFIDYRIKSIEFSDFRSFPKLKDKAFGLSFTTESKPSSCIFLGSNGTGKSSVFTALEYAYTGHLSHKESSNETDSYLNYAFSDKGATSLTLDLCSQDSKKEIYISNNSTMDFPLSFFCSEFDINTLSREQDLTKYILEQTGFADLWKIKSEIAKKIDQLSKSKIPENSMSSKRIREVLLELKNMIKSNSKGKKEELNRLLELESIGEEELEKTHFLFQIRWNNLKPKTVVAGKLLPVPDSSSSSIKIDKTASNKLLNMYKELSSLVSEDGLDKLRELVSNMETITENDDNEGITKEIEILGNVQVKVEKIISNLLNEICENYAKFIQDTLSHFSSPNENEAFIFCTDEKKHITLSINVKGYNEGFSSLPEYIPFPSLLYHFKGLSFNMVYEEDKDNPTDSHRRYILLQ